MRGQTDMTATIAAYGRIGKAPTLRTTKDVTAGLSRIDAGQYLTWSGRRLRFDATSEEWVITSISRFDINAAN